MTAELHPQRCETCDQLNNYEDPCPFVGREKERIELYFFTSKVGCASHSDFQSEREKVLESIEQLRYGIIAELTTGYKESDKREKKIVNGCFNKFIVELREQGEQR